MAAAGGKHVLSPPHASDYWSLGSHPRPTPSSFPLKKRALAKGGRDRQSFPNSFSKRTNDHLSFRRSSRAHDVLHTLFCSFNVIQFLIFFLFSSTSRDSHHTRATDMSKVLDTRTSFILSFYLVEFKTKIYNKMIRKACLERAPLSKGSSVCKNLFENIYRCGFERETFSGSCFR